LLETIIQKRGVQLSLSAKMFEPQRKPSLRLLCVILQHNQKFNKKYRL